jgi:hypothetical protein
MKIEENYASFINEETGVAVFVDSFDNTEFEVRIGTISESEYAGVIQATTSEELNTKLNVLFEAFEGAK